MNNINAVNESDPNDKAVILTNDANTSDIHVISTYSIICSEWLLFIMFEPKILVLL